MQNYQKRTTTYIAQYLKRLIQYWVSQLYKAEPSEEDLRVNDILKVILSMVYTRIDNKMFKKTGSSGTTSRRRVVSLPSSVKFS